MDDSGGTRCFIHPGAFAIAALPVRHLDQILGWHLTA
jgi:hypothetical protein